MINRVAPSYHVLNVDDRWSVDLCLNDEELLRCFNFEDVELLTSNKGGLLAADTRLRDFHNDPQMMEFNRSCIANDVRRALSGSMYHGEQFMHSHPFDFSNLLFIRYRSLLEPCSKRQLRFDHRVLA